jgi:hypothetical protein
VSIDARELAPSDCTKIGYEKTGPNQNVILFHDAGWPHKRKLADGAEIDDELTIALTTVTFDQRTGEIYDADIELNTSHHSILTLDSPRAGTFDLQSVLTHEAGHLFGLAHATTSDAVMFADDTGGNSRKRTLSPADIAGICEVYRPDRTRSVSVEVERDGRIAASACDPTPRRGLTKECAHDPPRGCSISDARSSAPFGTSLAFGALAAAVAARRVRRRRRS